MKVFAEFVAALMPVMWDLFVAYQQGAPDVDAERELALRIVRAAKDAQARREIAGE